jgi:hypothetical protein
MDRIESILDLHHARQPEALARLITGAPTMWTDSDLRGLAAVTAEEKAALTDDPCYPEGLAEPDEDATMAHMRRAAALAVMLRDELYLAVEASRPILTLLLAGHAELAAELQSDLATSVAYYEDDRKVRP